MRFAVLGVSLTELMVATALLATATAGGLQAYSLAQSAHREAGIVQQLQERAQYALATLEPDVQMAGYFGGSQPSSPLAITGIPEGAASCDAAVVARIDLPIEKLDHWTLPCDANGGGAVPESDVLIIRRVAARNAAAPERGRAQWLGDASGVTAGQLHWQGDAPWTSRSTAQGQELHDLLVRIYYIARDADGERGIPSLRMKSLTRIAGAPAFIDTEVMPGVEELAVQLLPSPAAPRTVYLTLRIRTTPAAAERGAPRTFEVSRHFTLRNVAA